MEQISNDEFTSKMQHLRKTIRTYFGQDPQIIRKMPILIVIENAKPLALITAKEEGYSIINNKIVISITDHKDIDVAIQNLSLLNQSLAEVSTIQKNPKKVQKQSIKNKKISNPSPKVSLPKKKNPEMEKEKMKRSLVSKEFLSRDIIFNINSFVGMCALFWLMISLTFGLAQEAFCSQLDEKYSVDLWTISHIAAGIWITYGLYFLKGDTFNPLTIIKISFALLFIFEIGEWATASLFPNLFQETLLNRIVDLIANGVGCAYASQKLSKLTVLL